MSKRFSGSLLIALLAISVVSAFPLNEAFAAADITLSAVILDNDVLQVTYVPATSGTVDEAPGTALNLIIDGEGSPRVLTLTTSLPNNTVNYDIGGATLAGDATGNLIVVDALAINDDEDDTSDGTGDSDVLDNAGPIISTLVISTSNASGTDAKSGDTVTIDATFDETLTSPTKDEIVISPAGGTSLNSEETFSLILSGADVVGFSVTYTLDSFETEGALTFNIPVTLLDDGTNPIPIVITQTSVTEGAVNLDFTNPVTPATVVILSGSADTTINDAEEDVLIIQVTHPTLTAGDTVTLNTDATAFATGAKVSGAAAGTETFTDFNFADTDLVNGETPTLSATTTDIAGNTNTAGTLALTVDKSPSSVPLIVVDTDGDGPVINTVEDDAGFDVTVGLNGALENEIVEIFRNNVAFSTPQTIVISNSQDTADVATFKLDAGILQNDLTDGAFTLTAITIDVNGNPSTEGLQLELTLDETLPPIPLIVVDTDGDGPVINVAEDAAGFDVTVGLNGGIEGDTLEIFRNNAAFTTPQQHTITNGEDTADVATFKLDANIITNDLATGAFDLTAIIVDVNGNPSAEGPQLDLTLDETLPPTPLIVVDTDGDGPTINIAEDDAGFDVTVGLNAAVEGDTLEIFLGGVAFSTPQTIVISNSQDTADVATFKLDAGILQNDLVGAGAGTTEGEAAIALTALVIDTNGNPSAEGPSLNLTLDESAGTIAITAPADETITNNTTPTISGTRTDTRSGSVDVISDNPASDTVIINNLAVEGGVGTWGSATAVLAEGTHNIFARHTDNGGNTTDSATQALIIDNTPPALDTLATRDADTVRVQYVVGASELDCTTTVLDTDFTSGGVGFDTLGEIVCSEAGQWVDLNFDAAFGTGVTPDVGQVGPVSDKATNVFGGFGEQTSVDGAGPTGAITYSPGTTVSTGTVVTATIDLSEAIGDAPALQVNLTGAMTQTITATKVTDTQYTAIFVAGGTDGVVTLALATAEDTSPADNVVIAAPTSGATFTIQSGAGGLTTVTTASDNPLDTSLARDTDTITVTFISANPIQNIVATINNQSATIQNTGGNNWIAFITIDATEADGAIVFTIDFEDLAGTAGTQVTEADITAGTLVVVDNTAPVALTVVSISTDNGQNPTQGTIDDDATLLFTTPETTDIVGIVLMDGDDTTEDALGGGDYSATHTIATTEGTLSFSIDYTDAAGNPGPTTTTTTDGTSVNVDTTNPAKPVITSPANSVTLTSDLITVTGTAEANSTVNVNLLTNAGNNPILTVTAGSTGAWTGTTTTVADGADVLLATATDAAGNTSINSDPVAFTMNATPRAPIITTATNLDTQTPTISGTSQIAALVKLTVDGTSSGQIVADGAGAWSITVSTLQTEAAHTATATATTANGESPASAGFAFTVDLTLPDAPVITTGDGTTFNIPRPTITGTGEAGATILLTSNIVGGVITTDNPVIVDGNGNWSLTPNTDLVDAVHILTATQTDAATNVSPASAAVNIEIATPSDAPVILTVDGETPTAGVILNTITIDNPVIVGTSAAADTSTITVKDGATNIGTTQVTESDWTFNTTSLSDGLHSVTATVTTPGGTSADSNTVIFTIDTTGALIASVTIFSDNANDSTLSKADDTVTVTITATEPITVTPASIDTNAADAINQVDANTVTFTRVMQGGDTQGPVVFSATVEDVNANSSTITATTDGSSVTHDSIAPTVLQASTLTSDNADATFTKAGDTATLNLVQASEPLTDVVMTVDAKAVTVTADDGTLTAFTGSKVMLSTDSQGSIATTIDATDLAGNALPQQTPAGVTHDSVIPIQPMINASGVIGDDGAVSGTSDADTADSVSLFDSGNLVGTDASGSNTTFIVTSDIPYADGIHSFTAQSTDAAGNVSPLSDVENITVADATPTPPLTVTPTTGSFTNDTTPDFAGTSQPGMEVKLFTPDSGGTQIGFAVSDSSGAWSITSSPLAEGIANYITTGEQPDTDTSADSADTSLTVDITAPTTSPIIDNPVEGSTTNDSAPTIDGTWTDNGDASVNEAGLIDVLVDGVSVGTDTVVESGWSVTVDAETPLANGSHTITLVVTDGAGNAATAPTARTFTVDAAADAPIITSVAGQTPDGNGNLANDVATATPAIAGTTVANASIQVFDGAGSLGFITADANGDWTFTPTADLGEGAHVFTATATTSGGTSAASTAVNAIIDTTVPTTPTIASPANGSTVTASAFTVSGNGDSTTTINVLDTDGTVIGTTTAAGGTYTVVVNPLINGAHAISAISTNSAGTVSQASTLTVVTVNAPLPAAPAIDAPVDLDTVTEIDAVTVTGTATAVTTITVFVDDVSAGTVISDNNGDWSIDIGTLLAGSHAITAKASDAAGNTSAASNVVNITVVTIAPVLTTVSIASDNTDPAQAEPGDTVTVTFIADKTIQNVTVTIDGNAADSVTATEGVWTATRVMQSGDTLGTVTFAIDFEDTTANAGTQVTATTDTSSVTFTVPAPSAAQDDIALFRAGTWFIDTNFDGTSDTTVGFGDPNDTPLVGEFSGDGIDDITLFRAGTWFIDINFDGTPDATVFFGDPNDTPLVGEFSGDVIDDIALFRAGTWFIDSNFDGTPDTTVFFGDPNDTPLVGEFGGSSVDDIALFRAGTWFIDTNFDGTSDTTVGFGDPGDTPLVGDISGDGIDDIILFRAGTWFIDTNFDGTADITVGFGDPGDTPLVGDFNADGSVDIALFRAGTWFIDTNHDGTADITVGFGDPGDTPLVGDFSG